MLSRLAENPQPAAVAKPSASRGTSTPHPRDSQMDATIESNGRASSGGHGPHTHSRTSFSLLENFDRPIAFHRSFVTLTGSVTAALMLSQAMYWQKRTKDPDGWWFKTREEWTEETGMTRYEQESARKRLRALGLLEEELRGVPAQLWYRLDEARLLGTLVSGGPKSGPTPASREVAVQLGENPPTGWRKTSQPVGEKSTGKLAAFPPSAPYYPETTSETTTTAAASAKPRPAPATRRLTAPGSSCSNDDEKGKAGKPKLLFDGPLTSLSPAQQDRAGRIVGKLDPETAQEVLDDWGQAIKTGGIRKSRWAWLESVTRRATDGTFVPTTDAAERRRAEERLRKAAQTRDPPALPQPLVAPVNRPMGRPEGLKRLLRALTPGCKS